MAKEGRLKRHLRTAQEIRREPRRGITLLRGAAVGLWVRRGAGFYGLGTLIAFVSLEIYLLTSELAETSGVSDFVTGQALEYLLRIGFMSLISGALALIWPAFVLQQFGAVGVLMLVAGYLVFERLLRPVVEARIPELKEAREQASVARQKKAARKKRKSSP